MSYYNGHSEIGADALPCGPAGSDLRPVNALAPEMCTRLVLNWIETGVFKPITLRAVGVPGDKGLLHTHYTCHGLNVGPQLQLKVPTKFADINDVLRLVRRGHPKPGKSRVCPGWSLPACLHCVSL